jgi:predicted outer membrane repeat protein
MKKTTFLSVLSLTIFSCFFFSALSVSAAIIFHLPSTEYDVGTNPLSITSGLINNDEFLDLAVANIGSDNVSILLGVGDGTFESATNFNSGDEVTSVATGLFDDDAFLDLAVTNSHPIHKVLISLGNGDGTFAAGADYSVANSPGYVVTADLNNDDNIDIATANADGDNVSVLFGNGDGTFASKVDYDVGNRPGVVALGMFNDDEYLDIATNNFFDTTMSVLVNDGDGTFATSVDYESGVTPSSITSGLFDDDAFLDLAVTNRDDDNISLFFGVGDGTFDEAVYVEVPGGPRAIIAEDFNNDSLIDLATNTQSNFVAILYGSGDGTFSAPDYYEVGNRPEAIVAGLFNDDEYLDLAIPNFNSANVSVILGGFDTVGGGEIVVNTLLDDGDGTCTVEYCTFRDAIANSRDGDTIVFDEDVVGTILLDKNETIELLSYQNITIEGPGAEALTIDFNDDYNNYFYFQNTGEVNISGLTFTNGPDTILYYGSETGTYNISDSVFIDNSVYAPIYAGNGDWNIDNVLFSNNSVQDYGGAIYYYGDGDLTITNSTFENNTNIYYYGGAVYFTGDGDFTVTNSLFSGNEANDDYEIGSSGIYGGAIYIEESSGTTNIINSTFVNNSAISDDEGNGGYGGAIYLYTNTANIINSTFSNNSAGPLEDAGGAIYADNSEVTIVNSIVSGIDNCVTWETGTITSLGHNIDSGATCGFEEETDLSDTDPLLDTEGLKDNGGNVETIALLLGSPAIDTGDDEQALETDARGYTRLGISDIGAYEYGGLPPAEEDEDICPNIDGTQTEVPRGKHINRSGDCVSTSSGGGGSSSASKNTPIVPIVPILPNTPPPLDCFPGYNFSPTTGQACSPNSITNPPAPQGPVACTILATLKQGSTGEEVKCLQTFLNLLPPDGIFGPKTKVAVILFQKAHNLVPDGVVGPKTRAVLKKAI